MVLSSSLGFPRIGANRELKKIIENYWKGNATESDLENTAKEIRKKNWEYQKEQGVDLIPSNDFSFYDDKCLDTLCMLGSIPSRYKHEGSDVSLETYFAMARGIQTSKIDEKAMEMSKFFDTNYHYIVPEFKKGQKFSFLSKKIIKEFEEAKALGIHTRPVIMGPISFLLLGKSQDKSFNQLDLLESLVDTYIVILKECEKAGVTDIQIDEPFLIMDLDQKAKESFKLAYDIIAKNTNLKIALTTYFGDISDNIEVAMSLPVDSISIDLVSSKSQLDVVLNKLPQNMKLSLGVVEGRNIWKNDFSESLDMIKKASNKIGKERIIISSSCSLLHSPVTLSNETSMNEEIKQWLSFATEKVQEISILKTALLNDHSEASTPALKDNQAIIKSKKQSSLVHKEEVKDRLRNITTEMMERKSPYTTRYETQKELNIPFLPTTTIGSFPQTANVRKTRSEFKKGNINSSQYEEFLKNEIKECISWQEEIGLDILVHGEFERNDMVEYFGEQLEGFTFTKNGWVQSYGSRCVKPPIIFGDVSRKGPMTVKWSKFAQEQTKSYIKGMLTGPVTILKWSFVRNDIPTSETCKQIALAIRDEVLDLEKAGIKIIQIDEAALREGLPLKRKDWSEYLKWAVDSFRIAASAVQDKTQIHTHMCYSEFNDIIEAVASMDADVISIETSRSQMELLGAFNKFKYPNEIGPGVYDIHSPRTPTEQEIEHLLNLALKDLSPKQLWINPDCGLKTRSWPEVKPALQAMVNAAKSIRKSLN